MDTGNDPKYNRVEKAKCNILQMLRKPYIVERGHKGQFRIAEMKSHLHDAVVRQRLVDGDD